MHMKHISNLIQTDYKEMTVNYSRKDSDWTWENLALISGGRQLELSVCTLC